jgi:isoleucyl-tRNA synthetase
LASDLTPELRKEGLVRDFVRAVQEQRKKAGLRPPERITLELVASENLSQVLRGYQREILRETLAESLVFVSALPVEGQDVEVGGEKITLLIKKK